MHMYVDVIMIIIMMTIMIIMIIMIIIMIITQFQSTYLKYIFINRSWFQIVTLVCNLL